MANNIKYINLNSSETQSDGVKVISLSDTGAGGGSDVFWATYGTTTAADIEAASAAGKAVYCLYDSKQYTLAFIDSTYIYFSTSRMERYYNLAVHRTTNVWQVLTATYELSANKKSSWSPTPNNTNYPGEKLVKDSIDAVDKVFVVEYGVTPFADILAAYNANKEVICNYNKVAYRMSSYLVSGGNPLYIYMNSLTSGRDSSTIAIKSDETWTSQTLTLERTSDRVSTISGNETATTKYPNTKAVADALGKWGVISQTQTWTQAADNSWSYVMSNQSQGLIPQAFIDMWNARGGSTAAFDSVTGYFEFRDLKDISYEEAKAIMAAAPSSYGHAMFANSSLPRALFPPQGTGGANSAIDGYSLFLRGGNVEAIDFVQLFASVPTQKVSFGDARTFIYECTRLKIMYGDIKTTGSQALGTFATHAYSLEEIRLANILANISFPDSQRLSKNSLLYMINNVGANTITITLHASVYAKTQSGGEWYSDISTALAAHINVSIASA